MNITQFNNDNTQISKYNVLLKKIKNSSMVCRMPTSFIFLRKAYFELLYRPYKNQGTTLGFNSEYTRHYYIYARTFYKVFLTINPSNQ